MAAELVYILRTEVLSEDYSIWKLCVTVFLMFLLPVLINQESRFTINIADYAMSSQGLL